jgi:DNA invertase Pin-like site-specific DNA recombinase
LLSQEVPITVEQGANLIVATQQFNTTTSMGRLTLNVLLSFAQFEREVIGERTRDKIAASNRRGCGWAGCHRSGIGHRTASSSSSFDYQAPDTLREAIDLFASNPEAFVIAGGQSLMGEIPDGHRWGSSPKIRFAPDSRWRE